MKYKEFFVKNKKSLVLLFMVVVILESLIVFQNNKESPFIYENGKLVALDGSKMKSSSVPINVEARNGNICVKKGTYLNLKKAKKHSGTKKNYDNVTKNRNEMETFTSYEVNEVLKNIKSEGSLHQGRIYLPSKLPDGTSVEWSKGAASNLYLFPLMIPLLVMYMYRRGNEKAKKIKEEQKNSYLCNLPSFNNQLILLLDSGLVLSDAMNRIIDGFELLDSRNCFQERLITIRRNSISKNVNLFSEMKLEASEIGIRDFTRIVNILVENQYRGIDVKESLTEEAVVLWSSRRRNAEELGKKAEIKLAFPMALFLVVLIIITALPAMMNVKGGLL